MAVYADREAFIPYRKADVVELCIEDGKLSPKDGQKFREFCEIVGAYYHFDFHKDLEELKNCFAPFDPDSDTKPRTKYTPEQQKELSRKLVQELGKILEKANYSKLTDAEYEKALSEESLITLKMHVDLNDYDQWIMYHRGNSEMTVEVKKMGGLKKKSLRMETYDRVMLFLQFKDKDHFLKKFKGKAKKLEALNFTPGKTYLYMYKNIPKADLEVLFPNVEISMNLKDKLMLFVPAGLAGIATLFKLLPQLLLIVGILAFLLNWTWLAGKFGADPSTPMFTIDSKYESELDNLSVPAELIKGMKDKGIKLSPELKLKKQDEGWLLTDKQLKCLIKKELVDKDKNLYALHIYQNTLENLLPIIIASLSALIVLGSFAFKQYVAYKNKRIQFLKQVTDTLFFKNLVCNGGVFNALIDSAEDEECKEVFLAYYHLLANPQGLTQEQLDDTIEQWLEQKFGTKIDFNVEKALEKMTALKGKLHDDDNAPDVVLLTKDDKNVCKVLKIDDAKTVIDYIWDNIFSYNE